MSWDMPCMHRETTLRIRNYQRLSKFVLSAHSHSLNQCVDTQTLPLRLSFQLHQVSQIQNVFQRSRDIYFSNAFWRNMSNQSRPSSSKRPGMTYHAFALSVHCMQGGSLMFSSHVCRVCAWMLGEKRVGIGCSFSLIDYSSSLRIHWAVLWTRYSLVTFCRKVTMMSSYTIFFFVKFLVDFSSDRDLRGMSAEMWHLGQKTTSWEMGCRSGWCRRTQECWHSQKIPENHICRLLIHFTILFSIAAPTIISPIHTRI